MQSAKPLVEHDKYVSGSVATGEDESVIGVIDKLESIDNTGMDFEASSKVADEIGNCLLLVE